MRLFSEGQYLLDGYITLNNPKIFNSSGKKCSLQYYQKKHRNEYVIKDEVEGKCYLYKNGILEMLWQEENGLRKGDFISLEKGVISFVQDANNLLNKKKWLRRVNDKRGELLEIWDGDQVIYRGEFNKSYKRHGIGIVYDEVSGNEEYEGIFKNNMCIQILKVFDGDEMIELLDNGNNVDVANQIPIYVGGWTIDENGEYVRNGIGYLIDSDTRVAYAEVIYENGVELKRRRLFNGWYKENSNYYLIMDGYPQPDLNVTASSLNELMKMNDLVTHITVVSNCCNDVNSLDLSQYKQLKAIEIGDDCFENADTFQIDGLKHLKLIKIGMDSFTHLKSTDKWDYKNIIRNSSRSFHILNCDRLEWIEIGRYSFCDYDDEFELNHLPSLSSIKIGIIGNASFEVGSLSYNFLDSSFVVKDLPNLQSIELGFGAFKWSLSTVMSNLPNLKSIHLGRSALCGRNDDSCSLEMKDLPKLEEITSSVWSFTNPHSVTLSNIPNLEIVTLPRSFQYVKAKSVSNVSSLLADLVTVKY